MSNNRNAVLNAETLLLNILKTQPNLLMQIPPSDSTGQQTGQFITALRNELIAMYEKTPIG